MNRRNIEHLLLEPSPLPSHKVCTICKIKKNVGAFRPVRRSSRTVRVDACRICESAARGDG